MSTKVITVHNAGNCTAYELRQELLRRNAFDLDDNSVNFKSMLQRLMVELVAEENKIHEIKVETALSEANQLREAAKLDREKKKQEALERSKQRQANPEYFQQRQTANADAVAKKAEKAQIIAELPVEEEEVEVVTEIKTSDDPFRSYVPKSKNKISVR